MAVESNRVVLPPDLVDKCEDEAAQLVEHHRRGKHPHTMPWSRGLMSDDELCVWLASREEAGKFIDIERCELGHWAAYDEDPYGIREALGEKPYPQISTNHFARSPDSNGWVWEGDLPPNKAKAMYRRIAVSAAMTIRKDH